MEKLCVFCKHWRLSPGCPGYSEVTPGYDAEIGCDKDHWKEDSLNDFANEEEFRGAILRANSCKDFTLPEPKQIEKITVRFISILSGANTSLDGTSVGAISNRVLIAEGPRDGKPYLGLHSVLLRHLGSSCATSVRFFFNNGEDPDVPGNNIFILEKELPAFTDGWPGAQSIHIADFFAVFASSGLFLEGDPVKPKRLFATLTVAIANGIEAEPIYLG